MLFDLSWPLQLCYKDPSKGRPAMYSQSWKSFLLMVPHHADLGISSCCGYNAAVNNYRPALGLISLGNMEELRDLLNSMDEKRE